MKEQTDPSPVEIPDTDRQRVLGDPRDSPEKDGGLGLYVERAAAKEEEPTGKHR